ncbi:serine/threonine-protein kinase HipA [Vibrio sp. ES.051]|uniref:type II toxin-antitoxin system HipA family toxin n=1 Tax=Vibrio sp. ES.051 TaxID=1761909 RepID=UPI000BF64BE8|nr:type II toxin-antitoxin system HipA family toxin [Vibrio sp. ES.051]PFG45974.1 serine/threonine-protein kinase HipA [Vibrio sp. ES.051]
MVNRLHAYMNGIKVGVLEKRPNGAHVFTYDSDWISAPNGRPISLSMPLRKDAYTGSEVINFFDNLLPDNQQIRDRIAARYKADTKQPFDLLAKVGRDSVGAITLVPEGVDAEDHRTITAKALSEEELVRILQGYMEDAPLGMLKEEDDFRISIAGAQEKTALLFHNGRWMLPQGMTPTTHIIKLPIGEIVSQNNVIDLSASVDNELICMRLAKAFGIETANCGIIQAGNVRALSVERFDRKLSSDSGYYLRLPHEDFCQAKGIPSARKYESDGGIGIEEAVDILRYSYEINDTVTFARSQILFWLLAAIDGHGKNFSVSIAASGRYQLAPLYDIISAHPLTGGRGLSERKIKMAMSLRGTSGRKWKWHQLQPRHFEDTFHTMNVPNIRREKVRLLLDEFESTARAVIDSVGNSLPPDINESVRDKIFNGVLKTVKKIQLTKK